MATLLRSLLALTIAATSVGASPPPIIDFTGDYISFFHATKNVPTPERVVRFKAEMAKRFSGFYDAKRVGQSEAKYDARIARSFAEFPAIEAKFTARAASVAGQLADAQTNFVRTFPSSGPMPPIYLVHSLGEMDGGTRDFGGRSVLVFGADEIARAHRADANERPFFEHELFHVYHEPRFGKCDPLWCLLWEEGLATYVASRLNPGAKDEELLLPSADMVTINAKRREAVCAVRGVFLSTNETDYKSLFTGGAHLPGLPERTGYFIGYMVAGRLGRRHSLQELANWSVAEARPRVEATLKAMANDCPPAPSRPPARPSSS